MRPRLRASPRMMIAAARSAGINIGIGKGFFAVMRETTNPGQITETATPFGARSARRPSPQVRTNALLAQYEDARGRPRNDAIDDIRAIWPRPRRTIGSMSGATVLMTPSTLMA